ncbi:hypothetical protein [Clostridium saccharoperbutylacetonicum]|uniref:hypothetical protein n=1 Tax=Clostridium saccharoperbutylacetonicum TaxID=36745 RepID=UPI0039E954D9
MAKDKIIELPEIQEFLKVSRTFERQLKIISNNEMSDEYKDIVNIALLKLKESIQSSL